LYLLTLRSNLEPSLALRPLLQAVAALPPPELPGLLSRHWQQELRTFRGSYLFDALPDLRRFAEDASADPAVAALAAAGPNSRLEADPAEEVGSADVFDRPAFIISAPRSGSTLLFDLLCGARDLWGLPGESRGVIEGIGALHPAHRGYGSHRLDERDAGATTVRSLKAGFLAGLRNRQGTRFLDQRSADPTDKLRMVEKTPENSLRVPFLNAAFPDARFVFLHRDARQSISSLIEAWQHGGFVNIPSLPGWERGEWCFLLPPDWKWLNGRPLSDIAAVQWHAGNGQALDDLAAIERNRWMVVEYADLVAHPDAVVQRVLRFLEIEVDAVLANRMLLPLRLTSTTITPPSPIKWRSNRDLLESSYASMGPMMGRLRNLSTPAGPAKPRPPRSILPFSCFLDELPAASSDGNSKTVNPGYCLQAGVTVPLPVMRRTRHRDRFLADYPVAWVEDAATHVLYPFWAQRHQLSVLRTLHPGRRPPPAINPSLSSRLAQAGILVDETQLLAEKQSWEVQLRGATEDFFADRWCSLPNLIQPAYVAALSRYYRSMIDSGQWGLGDDQVAKRHGWYNEQMARYFQFQLVDVVGRVAGEPVKPTYAYSSAYRGGATLGAHMDRKQCEYTLSVLIDNSRDADSDPWPLWFQTAAGKKPVTMEMGGAVLFRGCELPHWREAAREDQHQTMLLFHYVPATFVGVLS
jgi:sulfotransferase family protein